MNTSMTAADFFAAALAYQTDPADLAAERASGSGPVVIDVRSQASWAQGRIPGALHLPSSSLGETITEAIPDLDTELVVYCWGPGCNASTKAALTLVQLGYTRVRELIGGFEYWAREGLAIDTDQGRSRMSPDPLAAPVSNS